MVATPPVRSLVRLLPAPLVRALKRARHHLRRFVGARRLKRQVRNGVPLRIVVGSEGVVENGWIKTDIDYLNLLRREDWKMFFVKDSVVAILAEHVWEHLSPADGRLAARFCYEYLRPGGHLRIAVPDGFHPSADYIEWVRIGGTGVGADDHKVLYTHETLGRLLADIGFEVELLEYFDVANVFHAKDWQPVDGMVHRSRRFDKRNQGGTLRYTSLIVDAHKPLGPG